MINYTWLVVEPTPLKNMKVNGKDDIPYMKWKIKAMFETTTFLYLFALHAGLVVETSALAVYTYLLRHR